VSLFRLCRQALPHAAAVLLTASLVASCETAIGSAPQTAQTVAEASPERVILQTYRLIGDRHLNQPDFRKISVETYRGFASADPALSLEPGDQSFALKRDGKEIASRPTPSDPTDGRAWGTLVTDLFVVSVDASPVLKQTDRGQLTKAAMIATTKQLDKNSRYADPDEARDNRFQRDGGGGVGITVERLDDSKTIIRAVQDDSPSGKAGLMAGDQVMSIDDENMIDRPLIDVVHKLRGPVGAPVSMMVLRPSEGRQITVSMKRGRIIPTTVTYERRGDLALIHLIGFNTATTDTLIRTIDKARGEIGPGLGGIIIDLRGNRGGLLDQAESVSERQPRPCLRTADRHPGQRQLRVGGRDRLGGAAGSRPRRRGRHHELRQGHRADRRAPAQPGRAGAHLVAVGGALGLFLERARRDAQCLHRQGPRCEPAQPVHGRRQQVTAAALARRARSVGPGSR
jgi:carboxyl-terminal processing protease